MADRGLDLSGLPKEVRDQLAELDLELSEGKGSEGWRGCNWPPPTDPALSLTDTEMFVIRNVFVAWWDVHNVNHIRECVFVPD